MNREETHVQVDSAFPGGNIVLESIRGDEVLLHQDIRDTTVDWFYWYFRLMRAAGRTVRFRFTQSRAIGVRGPAVSLDQGATWSWIGADAVDENSFSYSVPADASEARLSFTMPYVESHWRRFMDDVRDHPAIEDGVLCVTPKGRNVDTVLLRSNARPPEHRIVITCRHHCCETIASYVLEGLVAWILRDPGAAWLRENAEILCLPFVDKDGVEDGDQGKSRHPRDHNRDYDGTSVWASTRAIREEIPGWADGRLRVGIDLHCPHIAGPQNEVVYLVGSENDSIASEQRRFSEILEAVRKGPLPFSASDYLAFGEGWNTRSNYASGKSFCRWLAELPSVRLSTTVEVPYANAGGAEVNQGSARRLGADLANALAEYLRRT